MSRTFKPARQRACSDSCGWCRGNRTHNGQRAAEAARLAVIEAEDEVLAFIAPDWGGCTFCGSDCFCCCRCSELYLWVEVQGERVAYPHMGSSTACGCWDCEDAWASVAGFGPGAPGWCDTCGGECRI